MAAATAARAATGSGYGGRRGLPVHLRIEAVRLELPDVVPRMLVRVGDGRGSAVDTELREDPLDVGGYRLRGHHELGRDRVLIEAPRQTAEDVALTRCQRRHPVGARVTVCMMTVLPPEQ